MSKHGQKGMISAHEASVKQNAIRRGDVPPMEYKWNVDEALAVAGLQELP